MISLAEGLASLSSARHCRMSATMSGYWMDLIKRLWSATSGKQAVHISTRRTLKLKMSILGASQGLWPLQHPLINKLTVVRALQRVNTSPDWKLSTVPEIEPSQRQMSLSTPTFAKKKKEKWPSCCFSTTSPDSHHVRRKPWLCLPTSPYPTFFVTTKSIFKMDWANW